MASIRNYIEPKKQKILIQGRVSKDVAKLARITAKELDLNFADFIEIALKKACDDVK